MVTGANGFIGQHLVNTLVDQGFFVVPTVRAIPVGDEIAVGNVGPHTDWSIPLKKKPNVVIHLAAQVSPDRGAASDHLKLYRTVNVSGSLNLARQAFVSGVKRIVYLSTIKVNGESTFSNRLYRAGDLPTPESPYAISKYEAELALSKFADETGMEVTVIRPPLVYGPKVKGNFQRMINWLERGTPLPFGGITQNRRSFVALDNLVNLIITCAEHRAAANQTFLVSDGEDISTADLLKRMCFVLGTPNRSFYMPIILLKVGLAIFGKTDIYQRLCGSLQLDIVKTREVLNWSPPVDVAEGLRSINTGR